MPPQSGSTFIELLITLIILSTLLLGLDAMQITTLNHAKSAYYFSVAIAQLNVMAEHLSIIKNADTTALLQNWNQQNQDVLPAGRGTLQGVYPNYSLTIFWGNKNINDCHENKIGPSGCLQIPINI